VLNDRSPDARASTVSEWSSCGIGGGGGAASVEALNVAVMSSDLEAHAIRSHRETRSLHYRTLG
jgi:hypothetical protein